MKMLIPMFLIVCLVFSVGFVGCKEEAGTPFVEGEKIPPRADETIPSRETPLAPAERQSPESQKTDVTKAKGSISAISPDTGQVTIKDESGEEIFLYADKDIALKDFNIGDQVVVEYTPDMSIKSINRQQAE